MVMLNNMLRKKPTSRVVHAVLLLISLAGFQAQAQDANAIPDPKAWAQQLPESIWTSTPGIVRSYAIQTKDAAGEKKWAKVTSKMRQQGFLQFVPSSTLSFFRSINVGDDGVLPPDDPAMTPVPVQLFLKDEGSRLNFQTLVKGQLKSLGKFGLKKEDRGSSEAFYRWLVSKFNYDAVVLDQRDDFILAAMLLNKSELGQGLLLKNSATRPLVRSGKQQGEALLQMLRIEGEFVIFESLLAAGQMPKIAPGSKILLGQTEQLKKLLGPASPSAGEPAGEEQ